MEGDVAQQNLGSRFQIYCQRAGLSRFGLGNLAFAVDLVLWHPAFTIAIRQQRLGIGN